MSRSPLPALFAFFMLLLPAPAHSCPEGMMTQHGQGFVACVPGPNYNPNPEPAVPMVEEPPPPDPLANQANFMLNFVRLQQLEMQRLQETLNADPELNKSFERQKKGEWKHFKAYAKAAPGEGCVTLYMKQGKAIAILGPSAGYKGALLAFMGPKLPAPDNPRQIPMTLEQSGEPSATVKVHNYRPPGTTMGAVAFAVPTLDDALSGMLDQHRFALINEGQKILEIEWVGGLEARDRLKRCADGSAP